MDTNLPAFVRPTSAVLSVGAKALFPQRRPKDLSDPDGSEFDPQRELLHKLCDNWRVLHPTPVAIAHKFVGCLRPSLHMSRKQIECVVWAAMDLGLYVPEAQEEYAEVPHG